MKAQRILLVGVQASIDPAANSSSTVFPYSASYGRTMVKTMLLAPDGGKSMVRHAHTQLQGQERSPDTHAHQLQVLLAVPSGSALVPLGVSDSLHQDSNVLNVCVGGPDPAHRWLGEDRP